jgi:D-alanine-D-alanine ligase
MRSLHTHPTNSKLHRDRQRRHPWRIALIANLKDDYPTDLDDPPDAGAEFDQAGTIQAIASALESDEHRVQFCAGDHTLPVNLTNFQPHICFNIAEGIDGDGREAQVPALCELMGIPYTASRVVANAISLDKTQTKRIWREYGLPTAPFREFGSLDGVANTALRFPLFVKPAREGTGMGVNPASVVRNHKQLKERVVWILDTYHQPALVEEYLPGREFTVGFIGNPGDPSQRRRPEIYNAHGYHWFPILEIDTQTSLTPGIYGHDAKSKELTESGAPAYLCPADIPDRLHNRLVDLSKRAAQALNVYDVARVDFRLGAGGEPYLMEINTLPGLNPALSDLCIMAAAEGLDYQVLITEILYLAAERFGLAFPSMSEPKYQKASLVPKDVSSPTIPTPLHLEREQQ